MRNERSSQTGRVRTAVRTRTDTRIDTNLDGAPGRNKCGARHVAAHLYKPAVVEPEIRLREPNGALLLPRQRGDAGQGLHIILPNKGC